MKKVVETDYDRVSRRAAELVVDRLKAKPDLVLGLATGSTPVGLYQELIKRYRAGEISFSQMTTFNLDEYCGLPVGHEQSYRAFMKQYLFEAIDIDQARTFFPNCAGEENYDGLIKQAGGIDVQILGIGRNGHIGFNEPGSSFESVTRITDLADSTIADNSRFFDNANEVPTRAMTMGLKTIMEAKEIILLASGESKREAIRRMINEDVSEDLPASVLRRHENVIVILDSLADGQEL